LSIAHLAGMTVAFTPTLTLADWSAVAQIGATVFAGLGIIISMLLTRRTLADVQTDRRLRHRPYLTFERRGEVVPVEFERGGRFVPGVNPRYAEAMLSNLPEDAESVVLANAELSDGTIEPAFYGILKNFGSGAALEVRVTWEANCVWIGEERFELDDTKKTEPLYSEPLNRMPVIPSHIEPGQTARLSRLPAFIVKDHMRKISRVEGEIELWCRDIFGAHHVSRQHFLVWPQYLHAPPQVGITFGETVSESDDNDTRTGGLRLPNRARR
jgi:hypothetical protein